MRIGVFPVMFIVLFVSYISLHAQEVLPDSIRVLELEEVVISESLRKSLDTSSPLNIESIGERFLNENFTGNLMQTLQNIPGIQSMDIGSGFSKPMIRGMGFNRVSVTENGVKQEGQQWGADHGLEIDVFNVQRITIRKGPSSLLYGSDAMGGVIEILPPALPLTNRFSGEAVLLGKSVNGTIGGSLMLEMKRNHLYARARFSEQQYGDYRVPTDTIIYLTQKLPVYDNKLKNTAGFERNVNLYTVYQKDNYFSSYSVSNVYQKSGFFPGAHGIPSASRLQSDGNSRNIDLPFNKVNHFKFMSKQQYHWEKFIGVWDMGFQNNHREEWSEFHTHYDEQPMPGKDPDKELSFSLNTYSSSFKVKELRLGGWEHTLGWDLQYQTNKIGGYSFLLPEYKRFTTGVFWLTAYELADNLMISGGLRYDYGKLNISAYEDPYLVTYLQNRGYPAEVVESYRWRSYAVNRSFGDVSGSVGVVWTPSGSHVIKANVGRSFRLPGANELASNGVHHGTFRHEQGNPSLDSEYGWQLDASYAYADRNFSLAVNPFVSWYSNYIYLRPGGEWSVLPHAGQVYQYTGAKAFFTGAEISFQIDFLQWFTYTLTGEYIYTYNRDENTPLSFSPPASARNMITWKNRIAQLHVELQSIATQKRVARNEDTTSGTNLLHVGLTWNVSMGPVKAELLFSVHNLLDTKYYNHLSFYRKVEIPEPGRNFQFLVRIPFNIDKQ